MFVGIEHRLIGETAGQELNAYARKGYKIALADEPSTTDVEDGKHASGGVIVTVNKEVASVADTTGGKVKIVEENEGRLAKIGLHCNGELQIFAIYFWHSACWAARNEALLEAVILRTRDTPYPWLIARDANVESDAFVQGTWSDETNVVRVPADVSTCRFTG